MALCALMVVSAGQKASADTYCFDTFNSDAPSGLTGEIGTVEVAQGSNSDTVTLTFNMTDSFKLFSLAFNTDLPTSNITDVTGPDSGAAFSWSSLSTDQQVNGFGTFQFELQGTGSTQAVSSGVVTVTADVPLSPADFNVLSQLPAGDGTAQFAAHVSPASGSTFIAGAHPCVPIPEPSSLVLSGLGLGGLGLASSLRRRLK